MSKKKTPNLAVSVRQRLLNLSQQRQEAFNLILAHYAIERFLFRLSQSPFEGLILTQAIHATFNHRQTAITADTPTALRVEFAEHPDKMKQWQAFLNRNQLDVEGTSLTQIVTGLQDFLLPPWQAIAEGRVFKASWAARGPWVTKIESISTT